MFILLDKFDLASKLFECTMHIRMYVYELMD